MTDAISGSANATITDEADNVLIGGAGNDVLDGGDGTDAAVFSGKSTDYQLTDMGNGQIQITDLRAGSLDGTDTLISIEKLRFLGEDVPLPSHNEIVVRTGSTPKTANVATLVNGEHIYVWDEGTAVKGQVLDVDGNPVDGLLSLGTASGRVNVAALQSGGFVTTLITGTTLQVNRYTASGAPDSVNPTQTISGVTPYHNGTAIGTTAFYSYRPAVAVLNDGSYVVTWSSTNVDGANDGVAMQRYDADGNTIGAPTQVNTVATAYQLTPAITALSNGGYAIAWQNDAIASQYDISVQTYDALGNKVGGEQTVANVLTMNEGGVSLTGLANGGFVATWTWHNFTGVYARIFNSSGQPVGNSFQVNVGAGSQQYSTVTALSDGSFVVAWSSNASGNYDIIGQRFDAQGIAMGQQFVVNTLTTGQQTGSYITADLNGGFTVTWQSDDGTIRAKSFDSVSIIDGTMGNDTLTGDAKNNIIYGYLGNDILSGGDGDDTLNGGGGADNMMGGLGNDTYVVDNLSDAVTENANEGVDTVQSGISYTLTANVENLTLLGSQALNGTGNSLDNVITGNDGNNALDGGSGNDTLIGGKGDDTYVIDSLADVITENTGEGTDTIDAAISYDITSLTNIENLTLLGAANLAATGNAGDNLLIGNIGDNILRGAAGNDTLIGGDGADVLDGGIGIDTASYGLAMAGITASLAGPATNTGEATGDTYTAVENLSGSAFDDVLSGDGGANYISGNGGNDTLIGGAGNDTLDGGAGIDTADYSSNITAVTVNLATGTATGAGTDTLISIEAIIGSALADNLTGSSSNDRLDGGAGADKMTGGLGDDAYVVENVADVVTEAASAGTDTVLSSIGYTLGVNVENLTLTGTVAVFGTGNGLANIIVGNEADNVLIGGAGNDVLDGGDGTDAAVFSGKSTDYQLTDMGNGQIQITDLRAGSLDGTDTLISIEKLRFLGEDVPLSSHNEIVVRTGSTPKTANVATLVNGEHIYVWDEGTAVKGQVLDVDGNPVDGLLSLGTASGRVNVAALQSGGFVTTLITGTTLQVNRYTASGAPDSVNPTQTISGVTPYHNGTAIGTTAFYSYRPAVAVLNDGSYVVTWSSTNVDGANDGVAMQRYDADGNTIGAPTQVNTVATAYQLTPAITALSNGGYAIAWQSSAIASQYDISVQTYDALGNKVGGEQTVANVLTMNEGGVSLTGLANGGFVATWTWHNFTGVYARIFNSSGQPVGNSFQVNVGAGSQQYSTVTALSDGSFVVAWSSNASGNYDIIGQRFDAQGIAMGQQFVVNTLTTGQQTGSYITADPNGGFTVTWQSDDGTIRSKSFDGVPGDGLSIVQGTNGDDFLVGDSGANIFYGYLGNDTYVVDNAGDQIVEAAGAGIDTVQASISYTLGANVENLTLTGTANLNGTGNAQNNVIIGNTGNNILTGGAGEDMLDGGVGADTLIGGTGNDTYVVDNTGDIVTENSGEGTDTVQSSITYTLGANVENLTLTSTEAIDGTGNTLDNIIIGNSAANVLDGSDGNDTLNGGGGADTVIGGTGADTLLFEAADLTSSVTATGGTGVDTLQFTTAGTIASSAFTNVTGIETINLADGTNNVTLNAAMIAGADGSTVVVNGGSGTDTLFGANVAAGKQLVLNGGDGTNFYHVSIANLISNTVVAGGANSDYLDLTSSGTITASQWGNVSGVEGMSTVGGTNNFTVSDAVVASAAGQKLEFNLGSGTNTIDGAAVQAGHSLWFYGFGATANLTGGAGNDLFEVIGGGSFDPTTRIVGGAGNDILKFDSAGTIASSIFGNTTGIDAIQLANGVNNLTLSDALVANSDNQTLTINAGFNNDTVDGSAVQAGHNLIFTGGNAIFHWTGGAGNDTFNVDVSGLSSTDSISGGAGFDILNISRSGTQGGGAFANVTGIDEINLSNDSANLNVFNITDAMVANSDTGTLVVNGSSTNDTLNASTVAVGHNVILNGLTVGDTLLGGAGNDTLDGGGGNDSLSGGGGYDTYKFNSGYTSTTITNSTAGGTAASGELDLGAGITAQDLWFAQSGQDLVIDVLGTTDKVTVKGWFGANASSQLSEIKTSDGMELDSNIGQLVSAMATFQASNSGFNPTTSGTQMPTDTNVQNTIASAWHHA